MKAALVEGNSRMVSDIANQVWNAFYRYAEFGEKAGTLSFSQEQLELTLTQFTNSVDRNAPPYKAIEIRLAELKKEADRKRNRSDVWKDRAIGIVIGVIITLLAKLIWRLIAGD